MIDGKACKNDIRVRRDVAESVILRPIIEELLAPEMIEEMVKEMRAYYEKRMGEIRAKRTKVPARVVGIWSRTCNFSAPRYLAASQVWLVEGLPIGDLFSSPEGANQADLGHVSRS